jgi:eukaryotic-like serine/threonine-protein kinase
VSAPNSTTEIPAAALESIALERGWVTEVQVEECRLLYQAMLDLGLSASLGEILVKKGYLSPQQCGTLESALAQSGAISIPGYEIIGKIAEGGMGTVYKARQTSMDRLVGIKILLKRFAEDKEGRERFLREARAVAKLSHPNVVAGIDAGEAHGVYYFVMEFLDGTSMDTVLRERGRLPWLEATRIVLQVAQALDHAHKHGIVHRDVKPGNIMLLHDGKVKLADLGLARVSSAVDSTITQSGMIVGSPAYLSPEQAIGDRELDIRSDIFSLGLTYFELIAGARAYGSGNPMSVMTALLTRPVPVERLAETSAPADVLAVISRMTRHDPAQRYAAPAALVNDLEALVDGRRPTGAYVEMPASSVSMATLLPALHPMAAGTSPAPRQRVSIVIALLTGIATLVAVVALSLRTWQVEADAALPLRTASSAEVRVDLAAAIEAAAARAPGALAYHAELEKHEYSIDFARGQHTLNVVIDAGTGAVTDVQQEDEDHSAEVRLAGIELVDALRKVQKEVDGQAIEAEILLLPGRAVVEVKLVRDGNAFWVDLDDTTGVISEARKRPLDSR